MRGRSLRLLLAAGVVLGASGVGAAPPEPAVTASAVSWLEYGAAAFRRALAEDRLVLLVIEVPWSEPCVRAGAELWRDPEVLRSIKSGYVPVRVRGDLRPDIARRYPAESWPAISIVLPDGSPLWFQSAESPTPRRMTAGLMPAQRFRALLDQAIGYYRANRDAALKTAQSQEALIRETSQPTAGPLSEALLWGLAQQLRGGWDAEQRYFFGPPRLPLFSLIELMLVLGGEAGEPWQTIGLASLTTLTTKLVDPADGGLQRAAAGLDWENIAPEKLLDRNARLLDLLTLAWRVTGDQTHRERAVKTASFLTSRLSRPDGSFDAGVAPVLGGRDETVLTGPNAQAAAALIRAGAALPDPALLERGLAAARFLKTQRHRPGRLAARAVLKGEAIATGDLDDQAALALAFLAAYEATGDRGWLEVAQNVAQVAVANLHVKGVLALTDVVPQPSAPTPLRRALYPLDANAKMVRALVRLFYLSGDSRYQRIAREILQAHAASPESVRPHVPDYCLALYEFHFAPLNVAVRGPARDGLADALRQAALGAAFPFVIVRTLDPEADEQLLRMAKFKPGPAALVGMHGGLLTKPMSDALVVKGVLAQLREDYVRQQQAKRDAERGGGPDETGAGTIPGLAPRKPAEKLKPSGAQP